MTELDEKALEWAARAFFAHPGSGAAPLSALADAVRAYLSHAPVPTITDDVREAVETVLRMDGEATKGPWQSIYEGSGDFSVFGPGVDIGTAWSKDAHFLGLGDAATKNEANGQLIAAFRTLAPLLARFIKTSGEPR